MVVFMQSEVSIQSHHFFDAVTKLTFDPVANGDEAGLTIYLNNKHHYEIALAMLHNKKCLLFRRQIGSLFKIEQCIEYTDNSVYLKLQATMQEYSFSYSIDGKNYLPFGKGECAYLTTEVGGCFTGNYIALYCTNTDPSVQKGAFYHFYDYQAYLPPQ